MPERYKVVAATHGEDKTHQSFKDECNVVNIVKRFGHNQVPTHLMSGPGSFGNFSTATDFQEMQNQVLEAHERFAELPAHVRQRFKNDPAEIVAFFEDPENLDEAIELGLLPKKSKTVPKAQATPPPEGDPPPE